MIMLVRGVIVMLIKVVLGLTQVLTAMTMVRLLMAGVTRRTRRRKEKSCRWRF